MLISDEDELRKRIAVLERENHALRAAVRNPAPSNPLAGWEGSYQRAIIGYHGCDRMVVEKVLLRHEGLKPSCHDYDWLGSGIYFWEYGCHRAVDWATSVSRRRPDLVRDPAALGAYIHLGVCLDLLDLRFTEKLGELYPSFEETFRLQGLALPRNEPAHGNDRDLVRRKLDCAMLNWAIPLIESELGVRFQTVRGVFQERGGSISRIGHPEKITHSGYGARQRQHPGLFSAGSLTAETGAPHCRCETDQQQSPLQSCPLEAGADCCCHGTGCTPAAPYVSPTTA